MSKDSLITCLYLGLIAGFFAVFAGSVFVKRTVEDWRSNKDYDRLLNTLIDGDMFTLEGSHTIVSGTLRVWISNYPYSFGYPYNCGLAESIYPRTRTKRRLKNYVERKSVLLALEKAKGAKT